MAILSASPNLASQPFQWASLGLGPAVMGILNITPDSFSDGGDALAATQAIDAGRKMIAEGADILDIGGESTRPGAAPVTPDEEARRVIPVISALASCGVPLSVDTRNASTMAAALDAGAAIVNDVSALSHDAASAALVAARFCPVVLMHMRGTPATMHEYANYDDVAAEVLAELAARVAVAEAAGIDLTRIVVDPGIGFAKSAEHNILVLQHLPTLLGLGCRVMVGVSRKHFIGVLGGAGDPKHRLAGSIAAGLYALSRGASILRVHNVSETIQAVRVWQALAG